jgi:hypothetical protein
LELGQLLAGERLDVLGRRGESLQLAQLAAQPFGARGQIATPDLPGAICDLERTPLEGLDRIRGGAFRGRRRLLTRDPFLTSDGRI